MFKQSTEISAIGTGTTESNLNVEITAHDITLAPSSSPFKTLKDEIKPENNSIKSTSSLSKIKSEDDKDFIDNIIKKR